MEIKIVLEMIKNNYKNFKRTEAMRPFYNKAFITLKELLLKLEK
jgi:hypothetical protein